MPASVVCIQRFVVISTLAAKSRIRRANHAFSVSNSRDTNRENAALAKSTSIKQMEWLFFENDLHFCHHGSSHLNRNETIFEWKVLDAYVRHGSYASLSTGSRVFFFVVTTQIGLECFSTKFDSVWLVVTAPATQLHWLLVMARLWFVSILFLSDAIFDIYNFNNFWLDLLLMWWVMTDDS